LPVKGFCATDTFTGIEFVLTSNFNDTVTGSTGDDKFAPGRGNDTIYGDDGIDFIITGAGSDVAYGGAGQDYYYNVAVADYVAGDFDTFGDLSADDYIFMPISMQGVTGVIDYNGGALIYMSVAGGTWYGFVTGQSAAFAQGHIIFG
jgi:Ca2+-binding RTX toxin-like protein